MEREGTAPLSRFLSAGAAGPWGWEQSPTSLLARYGSIRGASSFGVSTPKVFIDGIEVANPLLATQIAPEAVERIEVIRGPQGAALYGTDAISGVVNIVTRHEGTDSGAPPLARPHGVGRGAQRLRGTARRGAGARRLAARGDQRALRGAGRGRSAAVGEYVPEGGSRYLLAGGNARRVGARSVVTGTARFYTARAGPAENPLLRGLVPPTRSAGRSGCGSTRWADRCALTRDARWTHTLIAGMDGDRVAGLPDDLAPVPSAAEAGAPLRRRAARTA